jgi:hypothetical protein
VSLHCRRQRGHQVMGWEKSVLGPETVWGQRECIV